jgi:hypothetical protein
MKLHSRAHYARTARRFRQNRYLLVKGFLPQPLLEYLKVYYAVLLANDEFAADEQCPRSLSLGGGRALDAVLEWIRPEISRLVGFPLAPTYSYTRRYAKGDRLARHCDREAGEISVTLAIEIPKRAPPSELYLKPPKSKEKKISMREGDGCVYAGTEVEHWRERFRTSGYVQLFLHFVAQRGRHFPKCLFDGRESLGAKYRTSRRKKKA